ncbi:MAG: hypothetical protein SWZ49_21190 [Cyanobacteriota bacterium]|nr:hypothetical protein [Cyanobacteriota bacterium]
MFTVKVFSKILEQILTTSKKEVIVNQENISPKEEDKIQKNILLVANTKNQEKEKISH